MPTSDDVRAALRGVIDPELGSDIVDLGMVGSIDLAGTTATVEVALTIASCPLRDQIEADVVRKVSALRGIDTVRVNVITMTQTQRSELMGRARRMVRDRAEPTMVSPTTRVLAVSSGKGGVGKSTVAVNLALAMHTAGYQVGLLDADIWGFSVPRMVGATQRLEADDDRHIVPVKARGLHVVSTGLLVDDEETALMWRGLMLSKALEQFLRDVAWPPTLDYLVLDMPPGTGDIQMALARLLPQAEMVVVTTPQKAAQKVAARVADMARRSYMPVIGVIENMSGFTSGDGELHTLFGSGGGAGLAADLGVPLLGSIPLDPAVAAAGDEGRPVAGDASSPAGSAFTDIANQLIRLMPAAQDETCTARIALLADGLTSLE